MAWRGSLPLVALAVGLSCEASPQDPVILTLDDQVVRKSEFDRHVTQVEARGGAVDPTVRRALLDRFLEERVLVLEARARGLLQPGVSAEEEQGAVQRLLADRVLSKVEVADEEVSRYYEAHVADFRTAETVTLLQIVVPTQGEARDVRRRLQREPKSFATLARVLSHSPEASAGGLMGHFRRGELPPELEAAAFGLPVGGLSEVVSSPLGYHVLKMEAREAARDQGIDDCRQRIRALLTQQKSEQSVRMFVRSLLARAKVNHEAAEARPRNS